MSVWATTGFHHPESSWASRQSAVVCEPQDITGQLSRAVGRIAYERPGAVWVPGPAWSPDGRRIVVTNGRSASLQVASKDGSQNRTVLCETERAGRTRPDWRVIR